MAKFNVGDTISCEFIITKVCDGESYIASYADDGNPAGYLFSTARHAKLVKAAPRPIKVGDKVKYKTSLTGRYVVKAIDGQDAWIYGGHTGNYHYFSQLSFLEHTE